ncbi:hypothetical protein EON81_13415 [bacterium]|nr:MAG: hypothetical protein EON81_13415 [bacterium]
MAYDNTTPTAFEYVASFQYMGPDTGVFPVTAPAGSTAITSVKFNDLKFAGGVETRDFKAGQQLHALERIVSQASSVSGSLNLTSPSQFLALFGQYGPLVKIIITQNDPLDVGAEMTVTLCGLMKIPDMSFLSNPGTIDFEIRPYGVAPTFTITESS